MVIMAFSVLACSGGNTPAPLVGNPTTRPVVTLAPLATEAAPSAAPAATKKPTTKATPKPPAKASYYKPPGWDGSSDVDCPDFDTHAHAQSFFIGTGGSKTNDPHGLDREHDGLACETLP
jgi:hypothetical protein